MVTLKFSNSRNFITVHMFIAVTMVTLSNYLFYDELSMSQESVLSE